MEGAMGEWLAQGAWCDVRLACGGREFRAHRVVLSSVSPFLRVLLQSRPDEDIPTTIVMPEFEVEAMSAVLHYIYNGEVSVPTQHLDSFFTIVKTLQICVDKKALIHFREKIADFDTKILDVEVFRKVVTGRIRPALKNRKESGVSIATPTFTAEVSESKELDLERIIKGDRICKSVSPYYNETGYRGNVEDSSDSRQLRTQPTAATPQNADDRQPERSLRDSPQWRRGSNGPAACVPTITNVDNLQTSPAVTNGALVGPMSREIPSVARTYDFAGRRSVSNESAAAPKSSECTKYSQPNISLKNELRPQVGRYADPHDGGRLNVSDGWRINSCVTARLNGSRTDCIRKPAALRPVPTLLPLAPLYNYPKNLVNQAGYFRTPPELLDLSSVQPSNLSLIRATSVDNDGRIPLLSGYLETLHSNQFGSYRSSEEASRSPDGFVSSETGVGHAASDRGRSRRAAYNKVLAGPWCPRGPPTYRPPLPPPPPPPTPPLPYNQHLTLHQLTTSNEIRMSEDCSTTDSLVADEYAEEKCSSDSNNNVREVTSPAPPAASKPPPPPPPPADRANPHSIDAIIGKSCVTPAMRCATCDKVFTSRSTLASHVRAHASAATARHTCPDCGKSFSQLRNFKYHLSVHRGTREFAATCNVCGKYFNDRGYLSSHMKIHRNRKEYECPHCPKSFNQRVAYNMHVRIHTGVKPHVCPECGKAFSRKMLLKQHQRTHSGERPYACSVCDKRFADRSNMTLHMRLHSGVKPFSCTLCSKSFTKKHHLKTHLNYHTGDKPYSCPRCRLAFSQSSNMRTHLKKCSAPAPDHAAAPPPPALAAAPPPSPHTG